MKAKYLCNNTPKLGRKVVFKSNNNRVWRFIKSMFFNGFQAFDECHRSRQGPALCRIGSYSTLPSLNYKGKVEKQTVVPNSTELY